MREMAAAVGEVDAGRGPELLLRLIESSNVG